MRIYGITSCDSCRNARKWLDSEKIEYRFHDLRQDGLDIQMLERWSNETGWEKLLNKSSLTWRKLPEVDRENMTKSRAFASMIEHPTLVKRPILEDGKTVTVGFSDAQYEELLRS